MIPAATSRVAPQQYYCHRFYSHRGIAAISAPPSPPCRPGLQYGPRDPGCCWGAGCGGSRISWGRSHGSYVHNSMTELYDCATTSEAFVLSTSFLGPHVTSEPEPPQKLYPVKLTSRQQLVSFRGPWLGPLGEMKQRPGPALLVTLSFLSRSKTHTLVCGLPCTYYLSKGDVLFTVEHRPFSRPQLSNYTTMQRKSNFLGKQVPSLILLVHSYIYRNMLKFKLTSIVDWPSDRPQLERHYCSQQLR